MNSPSRSQPVSGPSAPVGSAEPSAALPRSEIVRRLQAGTLTMGEYMPFARAAFRDQFEAS